MNGSTNTEKTVYVFRSEDNRLFYRTTLKASIWTKPSLNYPTSLKASFVRLATKKEINEINGRKDDWSGRHQLVLNRQIAEDPIQTRCIKCRTYFWALNTRTTICTNCAKNST